MRFQCTLLEAILSSLSFKTHPPHLHLSFPLILSSGRKVDDDFYETRSFFLVFVFLAVLVLLDKVKIKCNAWTFFYLA